MSLTDLRNDLGNDIHRYALKKKGKWWANWFVYNKEVEEYKNELWKKAETLSGALQLSVDIRNKTV